MSADKALSTMATTTQFEYFIGESIISSNLPVEEENSPVLISYLGLVARRFR